MIVQKWQTKFKSVFQCHAKTKNVNGIWIPFSHAIEKRLALRYTHSKWMYQALFFSLSSQRSKEAKRYAWSQVSSLMIMRSMHFSRSWLVYFNREKSSVFPQISNYFLKKNSPLPLPSHIDAHNNDTLSSPRESVRPYLDDHRPTSEWVSGWTTRKFKGSRYTRAALLSKKKHWRCERFIGFWSQLWQDQRYFSICPSVARRQDAL